MGKLTIIKMDEQQLNEILEKIDIKKEIANHFQKISN